MTQINDGASPAEGDRPWPSSSASAPSVVFRMLEALDLSAGMRVLEIGTGTGLTSAYLAHRLGDANVVTIEVDSALTEKVRAALAANSAKPTVICGDGQEGSRRLWEEAEAAYRWWGDHGRPGPERFGLTVSGEGHQVWLDDPANSWLLRG